MTVLILTWSGDAGSVTRVAERLRERGVPAYRLCTDLFPTHLGLELHSDARGDRWVVESAEGVLDLADVSAVWYRRCRPARQLPAELQAAFREASRDESRAVLKGMVRALDVFHLDPEPRVVHAAHKPVQLSLARELGLETPRTLITNRAERVREFAARCPGGVIAKALTAIRIEESGRQRFLLTNELGAEDLADLRGLELCPMVFQERIPKACELRCTVIGDQLFAASIDPQVSADAEIDWRRDSENTVFEWQRAELPAEVEGQVRGLVRRLGLNYGAVDLLRTPDGRHVFLEINPQGEFAWLEENSPGLPLSSALAELLARRARPARSASPAAAPPA